MMRKLLALTLAAACAPALAQEMEPGEWRFDTTMTSPMMSQPQATTFTRCVRREDAAEPGKMLGRDPQHSDCTVTPGNKSSGFYTWEMSCPKSGMKGKGSARYGRDTVQSEMQLTGEMQGRKLEVTAKTSGKRLGPCKS